MRRWLAAGLLAVALPCSARHFSNLSSTASPTVHDDVDRLYGVGSQWINRSDGRAFVCVDATDGAAVWKEISNSGESAGVVGSGTYTFYSTGVAAAAGGTLVMDMFNAIGSNQTVRVLEVFAYARNSAAVTGVIVPVEIQKTGGIGTGGTAITVARLDTADPALHANITARTGPTGGAAALAGGFLAGGRIKTEEAALGTTTAGFANWFQNQAAIYANDGAGYRKRLVLNEGQGLRCNVGNNVAGSGLVACGVTFQIGAVGTNEKMTVTWQSNSAATANKNMVDLFNATGSGRVLRLTRVTAYTRPTAAVAGVIMVLEGYRTSAVGTGGTTLTGLSMDNFDGAIPAQVTARDAPTGGATLSGGALFAETLMTDETSDGAFRYAARTPGAAGDNDIYVWAPDTTRRAITIRENQGFVVRTGPLSGVANVVVIVEATVENP